MEPIHITYNELLIYVVIGSVIIGALLGLIPLILGIKKKKRNYGTYGFAASTLGGAISPLASLIIVSIFVWLILRKPSAEIPAEAASNESSVDENSAENN